RNRDRKDGRQFGSAGRLESFLISCDRISFAKAIGGRTMRCRLLGALIASILVQGIADAQTATNSPKPATKFAPPRTVDGHPDLQGIWSNAIITPLERPDELAGKAFLTEQEAADYEKRVRQRTDVDRRTAKGTDADVASAYNDSWYDRGTKTAKTRRTSLI